MTSLPVTQARSKLCQLLDEAADSIRKGIAELLGKASPTHG